MDLEERRPVFWRQHLVGYFVGRVSVETVELSVTGGMEKSRGCFTSLDCPNSREFMRLAKSQNGLKEDVPDGWIYYRFDEEDRELWVVSCGHSPPTVPAPDVLGWWEENKPARDSARRRCDTLRQDILAAIANGESDCAYELSRELTSMALGVESSREWLGADTLEAIKRGDSERAYVLTQFLVRECRDAECRQAHQARPAGC